MSSKSVRWVPVVTFGGADVQTHDEANSCFSQFCESA